MRTSLNDPSDYPWSATKLTQNDSQPQADWLSSRGVWIYKKTRKGGRRSSPEGKTGSTGPKEAQEAQSPGTLSDTGALRRTHLVTEGRVGRGWECRVVGRRLPALREDWDRETSQGNGPGQDPGTLDPESTRMTPRHPDRNDLGVSGSVVHPRRGVRVQEADRGVSSRTRTTMGPTVASGSRRWTWSRRRPRTTSFTAWPGTSDTTGPTTSGVTPFVGPTGGRRDRRPQTWGSPTVRKCDEEDPRHDVDRGGTSTVSHTHHGRVKGVHDYHWRHSLPGKENTLS